MCVEVTNNLGLLGNFRIHLYLIFQQSPGTVSVVTSLIKDKFKTHRPRCFSSVTIGVRGSIFLGGQG